MDSLTLDSLTHHGQLKMLRCPGELVHLKSLEKVEAEHRQRSPTGDIIKLERIELPGVRLA